MKYWKREPYLGFGADAHSFDGALRWQNPESAADYVAAPAALDRITAEPLSESFFSGSAACAKEWKATLSPNVIEKFVHDGLLERAEGRVRGLAPRGVLLSNEVFAEFIQPAG